MGRACSTHSIDEELKWDSGAKPGEDIDVGGRIILKWILARNNMECADLVQDRDQ
jgi:hypothetical protein